LRHIHLKWQQEVLKLKIERKLTQKKSRSIHGMVLLAMFIAIIFLLAFTPIGYINLPFIKATVVHIPVIIGSLLLGPRKGALLGFCFGVTSLMNNTMYPSLLSFAFSPLIPVPALNRGSLWALIICFVPRIMVGLVPWVMNALFFKITKGLNKATTALHMTICAILGSLTNTIFVMGFIFVFFRNEYASVKGLPVDKVLYAIMGIVSTNGLIEAIVAGLLTTTICLPLIKYTKFTDIKVQKDDHK